MTGSASAVHGPLRALAAACCLLHALVLGGLGTFYVVELAIGGGGDPGRVAVSAVLILLLAASLAVLGWLWWAGSRRAIVPTLIWNALLVPVAVGLAQSGQAVLGALLAGLLLASAAAALGASRTCAR